MIKRIELTFDSVKDFQTFKVAKSGEKYIKLPEKHYYDMTMRPEKDSRGRAYLSEGMREYTFNACRIDKDIIYRYKHIADDVVCYINGDDWIE